ncbi:hypothetical protein [Streptomyces sp. ALI-76-A]|jgi:transposase|uniref:hypothetical protein n=1 Tax=Streptomyces sp. ALI-76-A TaxID=3025736 RepID=UPI00256F12C1|nr:hypothetical protein [Streptomyces sp. ALI-76-A]MDL5198774.1 hypothetical protein [Streptomyces sp. ALI-76-A]
MLIVVGIDGHKNTHTLVAVDPLGKRLAELTVAARPVGHLKALAWLHGFGSVLVAVEDCRHLTRRFEADLPNSGHAVVRVHTRLMAGRTTLSPGAREIRPDRCRGSGPGCSARA